MSVVIHQESYRFRRGLCCSFCGTKLAPPCVVWDGMADGTDLTICGTCCRKHRHGLMADMLQIAAIDELRSLGYRGQTFDRRDVKEVGEEMREEHEKLGLGQVTPIEQPPVRGIKK